VDDDGNDVAMGTAGELLTVGPETFVGYTDKLLDDEAFTADGWYRTGDIGRMDAEGCLTIVDRKKDIIIRGGENISSHEVEDLLTRHPAVAQAAVVAMPDPLYGERACAFIILRENATLTLEEVRRHFVEMGVAKQKTPERLEFVDDLPRTSAGKVRKNTLRDRLKAG
jgi:non-ribosomal peptide synthetase component E (peptide arylation enzyme)